MNRRPYQPAYRESSTRALAWAALFFAVLAFLIACFTLLLTWQGGRLLKNVKESTELIRNDVGKYRQMPGGGKERGGAASALSRESIHERLGRIEAMVRQGDSQARFYLDNLKEDLERWRNSPAAKAPQWLSETLKNVDGARQKLAIDAPQAASRLRALADELQKKIPRFETPPIPADAKVKPEATPGSGSESSSETSSESTPHD